MRATDVAGIQGEVQYTFAVTGPDVTYKISYDYLTIMPKLRSTSGGRLIYQTSYEERKTFLWYDSLAKL